MRDYYEDELLERERVRDRREGFDEPSMEFRRSNRTFEGWDYGSAPHWRHRNRSGERDPKFGSDAYRDGLARDETRQLIASDKVEGTPVYDRHGRKLGSIQTLMLDKMSGEVVYAVVRHYSGFLGLDQRHFPLEWCELTYDSRVHGYGVDFTERDLERQLQRDEERRSGRSDPYRGYENQYRPRFYW